MTSGWTPHAVWGSSARRKAGRVTFVLHPAPLFVLQSVRLEGSDLATFVVTAITIDDVQWLMPDARISASIFEPRDFDFMLSAQTIRHTLRMDLRRIPRRTRLVVTRRRGRWIAVRGQNPPVHRALGPMCLMLLGHKPPIAADPGSRSVHFGAALR